MKTRVAVPMAAAFSGVTPQQVGMDFLDAAAIVLIVRILCTVLFLAGSTLEAPDLLGTMLIGVALLGFVTRRRFMRSSAAEVAVGHPPLPASFEGRIAWTGMSLSLLVFNLFCFFPGDFWFTMDIASFFLLAVSAYLQGISPQEAGQHRAG